MKAVIPCAKKDESLFPLNESKPTALMPVAGKPLVKHLISDLKELGVDDIYLVVNHLEESFRQEFKGYTDVNIVRQDELDGTAGAVEQCDFIDEEFIVVNGDVIVSKNDISRLIEKHRERSPSSTVLAASEDNPEKFGVLSITNDRVNQIVEKPEEPENSLVNTGIYVLEPEIFDIIDKLDGEKKLTEAVMKLVENNDTRFEIVEDYWLDIGSLRKLGKADEIKRDYIVDETDVHEEAEVAENVQINGNVRVGKNSEIKPGTVIEGPAIIGENCVLGPNTTVMESTVNRESQLRAANIESSLIFENNIVDAFTSVENSIIGENSDIKSNSVIRQSFIGPRSFVEVNNSIYGVKFVPDARTDLGEISK